MRPRRAWRAIGIDPDRIQSLAEALPPMRISSAAALHSSIY